MNNSIRKRIDEPRSPFQSGKPPRFIVDGNAVTAPPFMLPHRVTLERLEFSHMAGPKRDQPRMFANWKIPSPGHAADKTRLVERELREVVVH